MHWDVISVKPIDNLSLKVRFRDGTEGFVRFKPSHLTGVFSALADPAFFKQAQVEDGAVAWPGKIDLAPDAMYASVSKTGEWVLS